MAGWFEVWKLHGTALLAGCVLDWIFGDPYHFPHPVRLMGRMISWLEGSLRKRLEARELAAGFFLTAVMCAVWFLIPWSVLRVLQQMSYPSLWIIPFSVETILCYQMLAARSLCTESMKVCRSLESGDVEGARNQVSMIVGRDTAVLD